MHREPAPAVIRLSRSFRAAALMATIGAAACGENDAGVETLTLTNETAPPSPAAPQSGEPFVSAASDGSVLMSWIEPGDTSHSIRFARLGDGQWSESRTIAESATFFVNWADFPSIIELSDGRLAAHWLQRSGPGTYAYDVMIAFSDDGGDTWSEPVTPHDDGTETEHGFVSLFETGGAPAAVWLDGRNYADRDGIPASEEMTVRYAEFDAAGMPANGAQIDARACDCCQTAVASAASGPVLVYRDRSPDEIRDIAVTRLVGGQWTEPAHVHDDGWQINACPVNGPAIDADGDRVAVAWFTAAQDTARVRVAFSDDSGASFGEPIRVDLGSPSGRVDILLLDESHAIVSWLERTGGTAEVLARIVNADGSTTHPLAIGGSSAERASGFPRMTRSGDRVVFAWTVPGEGIRIGAAALVEAAANGAR